MASHSDEVLVASEELSISRSLSPIVKRAAVTYGRRREPVSDVDTSPSIALRSASSRASSYGFPSSGPDEDVPPGSDEYDALNSSTASWGQADNSDADDARSSSSHEFEFSWRKGLKDLDRAYALRPTPSNAGRPSNEDINEGMTSPLSPQLGQEHSASSPQEISDRENCRRISTGTPVLVGAPSRSPSPLIHRRRSTQAPAVHDSDSEAPSSRKVYRLTAATSPSPPTRSGSFEWSPTRDKGRQKARELDSDEELPRAENAHDDQRKLKRRKPSGKKKEKRTKAPTKKDREETRKATARMVADRAVSIPRIQTKQLSVSQLWHKIGKGVIPVHEQEAQKLEPPASDPIQPFSSSPVVEHRETASHFSAFIPSSSARLPSLSHSSEQQPTVDFAPTGLLGPGIERVGSLDRVNSSDDGMPEVGALLKEDAAKRDESERRRQLAEMKRRAMERQRNIQAVDEDEDDSDLEVVREDMQATAGEEAQARRAQVAHGVKRSVGKKNQLAHAGPVRLPGATVHGKAVDISSKDRELQMLKAAAAPVFGVKTKETKDGVAVHIGRDDLNKILLLNAEQQAEELTRVKEEEWVRRGGKIKTRANGTGRSTDGKSALLTVISKGLSNQDGEVDEEGAEADDNDSDYVPDAAEDGSAVHDGLSGSEEGVSVFRDPSEAGDDLDNDDDEDIALPRHRPARRFLAAVHSDDEDEPSNPPPSVRGTVLTPDSSFVLSPVRDRASLNHRSSTSSIGERTEDGTDKENDARLMYDQSEDKENTAVLAHSVLGRRLLIGHSGDSFDLNSWGGSPFLGARLDQDRLMESTPLEGCRSPLRELSTDDAGEDPFAFSSQPQGPARKLIFSPEVTRSPRYPSKSPPSLPGADGEMLTQNYSGLLGPAAVVDRRLSEFFGTESSLSKPLALAPRPPQEDGLSQFFTPETESAGLNRLRKAGRSQDLSLTLDAAGKPALEVSQDLLEKANKIFEKEQENIAENFVQQLEKKPLYVNEHGFLTQSLPKASVLGSSPIPSPSQIAKMTPWVKRGAMLPRSALRQPFAVIESDTEMDVLGEIPRKRLIKRGLSPIGSSSPARRKSSPSPLESRNAFDIMRRAARPEAHYANKGRRKLEKSEFVEGEAEESDDDAMMGFGGLKECDDEEDDNENLDQTLTELVDDAVMDEKTLAEEAVLEKAREHQQEDDQAVEKIHRDAIEGKYRTKRRDRGIGFEDSESDSDDENVAGRRMLLKKRKIEGDSLEQLAKNPDTLPFVEAYHADIVEGDEFIHLQHGEMTLVGSQEAKAEEEPEEEVITASEVARRLREVAREGKSHQAFNPDDLTWMDDDENDEEGLLPIKEVRTLTNLSGQRQAAGWDVNMQPKQSRGEDERDRARMQLWAKGESRVVGTGHSTRVSAVTGPGKRRTGGPSIDGQRSGNRSSAASQSTKPIRTAGALSAVSTSRRAKFRD